MTEPKKRKYSALNEIGKETPTTQRDEMEATKTPDQDRPLTAPIFVPEPKKLQGKRSNPDWKQFSILLKKESHKKAVSILRERYEGMDISDLMQALLEQWLNSQ